MQGVQRLPLQAAAAHCRTHPEPGDHDDDHAHHAHDQEDEKNKKVDDHIPNTSLPSSTSSPVVPAVAKNNFRKWEEPISLLLVHLLHRFQTLASPDRDVSSDDDHLVIINCKQKQNQMVPAVGQLCDCMYHFVSLYHCITVSSQFGPNPLSSPPQSGRRPIFRYQSNNGR